MMGLVRGIVNAVLMVTLVKPVVRLTVARWRKRAQESAATTMGIPLQELLETALMEELGSPAAELQPAAVETPDEMVDRGVVTTMLISGAVIAAMAGAVAAIAVVIRRRREAQEARAGGSEWVAVPVGESTEGTEQAVALEALTE
jgi:hypothetical protein